MREEIMAPGREIPLEGGRTTTIRYGFSSMALLEKEYGSVNGLMAELVKGEKGAIFSVLGFVLWAGTKRKVPLEAFLDMLDMKRVEEYSVAVEGALTEALGNSEDEPGKQEAGETSAEI